MIRWIFKTGYVLVFGVLIAALYLFTIWVLFFDWIEGLTRKDTIS